MNPIDKKRILVEYLRMKTEDQDWRSVGEAASDLKGVEAVIAHLPVAPTKVEVSYKPSLPKVEASVPIEEVSPTEIEIPHHMNEVKNLLKLSDEDLVDKLFPDYSQQVKSA